MTRSTSVLRSLALALLCACTKTQGAPQVAPQDAATPAPSQDGSVASQDAATNVPSDLNDPCRVPFDPEFAGCRATLEEAMREDTSCSASAECQGYTTWGYTGSFGSKICVYDSGSLVGYRYCSDAPQSCTGRQALCHIAGDLPPDCNPYPPNFPGIPLC